MAASGTSSVMLPVLQALASGEAVRTLEIPKLLPATEPEAAAARSTKPATAKQIADAILHLQKAHLVERVKRGVYRLTSRGQSVLGRDPDRIDFRFLRKFPEYVTYEERISSRKEARRPKPEPKRIAKQLTLNFPPVPTLWDTVSLDVMSGDKEEESKPRNKPKIVRSPYVSHPSARGKRLTKRETSQARIHEGAIESAIQSLHGELESQLVRQINALGPAQVVTLLMDVLTALGLGGPGPTVNDEGLDGIGGAVLQDALGVSRVYVMVAEGSLVTVMDLERFRLGLEATRAKAGILVSAAGVTETAKGFAAGSAKRITVIDFEELAYLMVYSSTGVTEDTGYTTKRVDEALFFSTDTKHR